MKERKVNTCSLLLAPQRKMHITPSINSHDMSTKFETHLARIPCQQSITTFNLWFLHIRSTNASTRATQLGWNECSCGAEGKQEK